MTNKTEALLESLTFDLLGEPLENRKATFWKMVKQYPKLKDQLLDFYVGIELDELY